MNLQDTLDTLKRNDRGQLFRKDRQVIFNTALDEGYRVGLVHLDDEGTIVVELVPDVEQSVAASNERLSMAFANPALGD